MKILWAIDPYEENKKLESQSKKIFHSFFNSSDNIHAAYVATDSEVQLATAHEVPDLDRYSKLPKKKIKERLASMGLPKAKVEIIREKGMSLTSAAKSLARFAEKSRAEIIVLSTYARTGLKRWVLGSFAESLIHIAKTDLLLYNENSLLPNKSPECILYSHDFTSKGSKGLKKVIDYAQKWQCALIILHVPDPSFRIRLEGQDPSAEKYRKAIYRRAHTTQKLVSSLGIKTEFILDSRWSSVDKIINQKAKQKKADLVAVTAHSNRLQVLIGGSVTRQVVRSSSLPTLVLKV